MLGVPLEADRVVPVPLPLDRGLPGVLRGLPDVHRDAATGLLLPIVLSGRESKTDD